MTDIFSNSQINPSGLPDIRGLQFKGLQRDYLLVDLIGSTIFWLFLGGGAAVVIAIFCGTWPEWLSFLAMVALVSLILLSYVATILGFRRKKYALREKDIIYKRGWLWRSVTVVPFNRVQHAEVQQGPIDRLFDLSKLKVYTAGGSGSDLAIGGLLPDEANRMKFFIMNKTASEEE